MIMLMPTGKKTAGGTSKNNWRCKWCVAKDVSQLEGADAMPTELNKWSCVPGFSL